jgi:hypothetical protein
MLRCNKVQGGCGVNAPSLTTFSSISDRNPVSAAERWRNCRLTLIRLTKLFQIRGKDQAPTRREVSSTTVTEKILRRRGTGFFQLQWVPFGTEVLTGAVGGGHGRGRLWVRVCTFEALQEQDPATTLKWDHLAFLRTLSDGILLEGWEEKTSWGTGLPPHKR